MYRQTLNDTSKRGFSRLNYGEIKKNYGCNVLNLITLQKGDLFSDVNEAKIGKINLIITSA